MTGPTLHPLIAEGLVRERHAELRREAARARLRGLARTARPAVRERAGWVLVEIGLRLAVPRG